MREKLRRVASFVLMICFAFGLYACGSQGNQISRSSAFKISEVSPPVELQRLNRLLDRYAPQVTILSPQPDQVLSDPQVTVAVSVRDLPVFKSALGLGPHVDIVVDEHEFAKIYDLNQPIVLANLTPGTHTLRAFASRPWDESFKNEGAFAQVTFHVLTRTGENTPRLDLPALTYHSPEGNYGAEPVLLDFYLRNMPLPVSLLESQEAADWQIRVTVNDESFVIEDWHPVYLKGLRTGQNWLKLEVLDGEGNLIPNIFNSAAYLINYQPGGQDTLSRLLSGETIAGIDQIVDPNYTSPEKTPEVVPTTPPLETPQGSSTTPVATPEAIPDTPPQILPETPVAPKPAPKSRFQFFKRAKPKPAVEEPVATPTPQGLEVVPTPIAVEEPADQTPANPTAGSKPSRFQFFKKRPENATETASPPVENPVEKITESEIDAPPVDTPPVEQVKPISEQSPADAPREELKSEPLEAIDAPIVTPEATPAHKAGRFELLKSRLENQKEGAIPAPQTSEPAPAN